MEALEQLNRAADLIEDIDQGRAPREDFRKVAEILKGIDREQLSEPDRAALGLARKWIRTCRLQEQIAKYEATAREGRSP